MEAWLKSKSGEFPPPSKLGKNLDKLDNWEFRGRI
jgi:hypothetical protein